MKFLTSTDLSQQKSVDFDRAQGDGPGRGHFRRCTNTRVVLLMVMRIIVGILPVKSKKYSLENAVFTVNIKIRRRR